jgi:hypothetical protein
MRLGGGLMVCWLDVLGRGWVGRVLRSVFDTYLVVLSDFVISLSKS